MIIPKTFDFNNDGEVDYREMCEAIDTLEYSGDEVAAITGNPLAIHLDSDQDDARCGNVSFDNDDYDDDREA